MISHHNEQVFGNIFYGKHSAYVDFSLRLQNMIRFHEVSNNDYIHLLASNYKMVRNTSNDKRIINTLKTYRDFYQHREIIFCQNPSNNCL